MEELANHHKFKKPAGFAFLVAPVSVEFADKLKRYTIKRLKQRQKHKSMNRSQCDKLAVRDLHKPNEQREADIEC